MPESFEITHIIFLKCISERDYVSDNFQDLKVRLSMECTLVRPPELFVCFDHPLQDRNQIMPFACPWLVLCIVDGLLEFRHLSIELLGCLEHLITVDENLCMLFFYFIIAHKQVEAHIERVNDRRPQICYLLILGPWSYLDCCLSVISVNIFVYKRIIV